MSRALILQNTAGIHSAHYKGLEVKTCYNVGYTLVVTECFPT